MLEIIFYGIHLVFSLFFFLLIPFVWLIKGSVIEGNVLNLQRLLRFYKPILFMAHIGVIVSLLTGMYLATSWFNLWFLAVFVVWLVLSAYLGITAKYVRLVLEQIEQHSALKSSNIVSKLRRASLILMMMTVLMFALKLLRYV
ncbi:hypothetical protein [Halalkalibacter hemicellulosilyticus]|uniref:Integral membrane protein n=1 Tax=Halalkalibacter hemicellulosilyticusJCM 9152 TaxID=1236971 RepID=W4QFI3_9BACI|nr:hypothetical protein [Halalkalibacter hemicellulosilyticus]GAE30860.1 hypothetical protein JCM9152_2284 [Halalkalibacter hemicellulosilyticusJCM 9152]